MQLFVLAALGGLVVGWVRHGSLAELGRASFRLWWLIPAALAAEFYIALAVGLAVPWWVMPLHLGTYALMLLVVIANWRHTGMAVVFVGLVLNALVIGLNGGLMPEAPETLSVKHPNATFVAGQHPPGTKDVVSPHDQTRLWWLGDVLTTPPSSPVQTVVSPGDLVLAGGLLLVVQGLMRPPRRRWEHSYGFAFP